jgi:hypothetical protein
MCRWGDGKAELTQFVQHATSISKHLTCKFPIKHKVITKPSFAEVSRQPKQTTTETAMQIVCA